MKPMMQALDTGQYLQAWTTRSRGNHLVEDRWLVLKYGGELVPKA